jgi:hypothetical protein
VSFLHLRLQIFFMPCTCFFSGGSRPPAYGRLPPSPVQCAGAIIAGWLAGFIPKRYILALSISAARWRSRLHHMPPSTLATLVRGGDGLFWLSTVPLTSGLVVLCSVRLAAMPFGFAFF